MRFNDSELDYLIHLMRSEGDERVPWQALPSYLDVQRASAEKQGFLLLAFVLSQASIAVAASDIKEALTLLEQARAYRLDQPPPG